MHDQYDDGVIWSKEKWVTKRVCLEFCRLYRACGLGFSAVLDDHPESAHRFSFTFGPWVAGFSVYHK